MGMTWQNIIADKFGSDYQVSSTENNKTASDGTKSKKESIQTLETGEIRETFSKLLADFENQIIEHNKLRAELDEIKEQTDEARSEAGIKKDSNEMETVDIDDLADPRYPGLSRPRGVDERIRMLNDYNYLVRNFTAKADSLVENESRIKSKLKNLLIELRSEEQVGQVTELIHRSNDTRLKEIFLNAVVQERARRNPKINSELENKIVDNYSTKPLQTTDPSPIPEIKINANSIIAPSVSYNNPSTKTKYTTENAAIEDVTMDSVPDLTVIDKAENDEDKSIPKIKTKYDDEERGDTTDYSNGGVAVTSVKRVDKLSEPLHFSGDNNFDFGYKTVGVDKNTVNTNQESTESSLDGKYNPNLIQNSPVLNTIETTSPKNNIELNPLVELSEKSKDTNSPPQALVKVYPNGSSEDISNKFNSNSKATLQGEAQNGSALVTNRINLDKTDPVAVIKERIEESKIRSNGAATNIMGSNIFANPNGHQEKTSQEELAPVLTTNVQEQQAGFGNVLVSLSKFVGLGNKVDSNAANALETAQKAAQK